jgi:hypothetical protein
MKINVNYRKSIVSLALAGFLFVTSGAYANTIRIFTLSADEWARPRSGDVIPELAAVRAAVSYWDRSADAVMLIRHPGEYIRLTPGTQAADEIKLVVGNRDELEQ